VGTSLLLEGENVSKWKTEFEKFTDDDEFVQFDVNVTNAFSTKILKFNNYAEDWEAECIRNKCISNENKLVSKYRFISFYDKDVKETRRIVNVEWHPGFRGGNPAQYVAVTQLLGSSDNIYESYCLNETLYNMIRVCRSNEMYDLIYKS
jgi:hypothetical protein